MVGRTEKEETNQKAMKPKFGTWSLPHWTGMIHFLFPPPLGGRDPDERRVGWFLFGRTISVCFDLQCNIPV
jgi:hypothetical protein